MSNNRSQLFFESSIRFNSTRIRAAAVYCSDGRLGDQIDELMHTALHLPRYDRLAVPGGAACLASHFAIYREEEGVTEQLRFLIQVHGLERVVLIAHDECAFYTHRLRVAPLQLDSQQLEDMRKAIARVRSIGPSVQVQAFFARRTEGGVVQFQSVEFGNRQVV